MEKLLEFRGIGKYFPGVKALDDVSFDLYPGEVHVIVGENGAGKSTLMKVLSGAYTADAGEILLEGKPITRNSPRISEELGIRMIYQELNLVPELSIASNVFLGHELKKGFFVDKRAQEAKADELLRDMGIQVDSRTLVKNLGVGTQQMVEIAKALSKNAKIIVFDEPTSSLTDSEIRELFRIIELLKQRGVGMFYISHRLEELFEIGSRVTVMRDGSWVYTGKASEMEMDQIISLMVGRSMSSRFPEKTNRPSDNVVLKVERLTGMYKPTITEASFELREGEILGIAGLVGSRRTELVETIFGLRKRESGRIVYKGKEVSINDPIEAISNRFALLTEERRQNGIFGDLSIRFNATISHLNDYCKLSFINEKKMVSDTQWVIDAMAVKTPNDRTAISNLSGGNQQKVIIGRWLLNEPEILMMDEPTRGIDVGAKYEIYKLMNELASKGKSILFVSSEMPELIGVADRILVMSNGRVAGILNRDEFDQEEIMRFAARYLG